MPRTTGIRRAATGLGLAAALAGGAGCAPVAAGDAAAPAGVAQAGAATAADPPTRGPGGASVDPTDPGRPRTGPRRPVRGEAYPYDLYTHCGIAFARFGGRTWLASSRRSEPATRPDNAGLSTYTGYTAGTMTLVDPRTARFVIDLRRVAAGVHPVVTFRPTSRRAPVCQ
ncbi:hypothetical protein [Pilimelia terevasa]|nr:hypothetical protein [Pilimelia terevasa]